ncbi:MAG: RNA methyltransferase [Lachnospiraceae bacterium]|nr:RNA methyltransferase [Lachnospiraceae bacterium]
MKEVQLYRYYEPDPGIFIAESANVALMALAAGYEPRALLAENERFDRAALPVLEKIAEIFGTEFQEHLPVYTADSQVVENVTGYAIVKGLWTAFRRKPLEGLEEFCRGRKKLAVLVDIEKPTNVGAIIRSAAALGADGVILTKSSIDPLTRRASRVSMGTVFQIPWTVAEGAEDIVRILTDNGFTTIAMALNNDSVSLTKETRFSDEKAAVLMGNEGYGLPASVIDACSVSAKIPMYNSVDSLNVAAASALAFFCIF